MLNQKSLTILSFLILSFLSFSCESAKTAKNQEFTLLSVKMETTSRGTAQNLNISEFETTVENRNLNDPGMLGKKNTRPATWQAIGALVSKIDLNHFGNFEAPSQDRLFDGARATTITLVLKDKTLTSQAFDEGNPPAELKELYAYLVSLVNQ